MKSLKPGWIIVANLLAAVVLVVAAIASMQAQTFEVIHKFTGGADGGVPNGLAIDRAGNIYGTTFYGGSPTCNVGNGGCGVVFKIPNRGALMPIYTFTTLTNGYNPSAEVTIGPDGVLYSTAYSGGANGFGTVFRVSLPPTPCTVISCSWDLTVLHAFAGGMDGYDPTFGGVVFDHAGNLYGSTENGGGADYGVVYQVTPSGGSWTETVLHAFTGGSDGSFPSADLVIDSAGNLYGTAQTGGSTGNGTVFELSPSGNTWVFNVIYNFQGSSDGAFPFGGLAFDQNGNLFGAAFSSGSGSAGTIFELTPSNGSWMFNVVYSFHGQDGNGPGGPLLKDSAGNFYGTAYMGGGSGCGGHGCGTVFKLTPNNGSWSFSLLHAFTNADGANPGGTLVLDSQNRLYGTTAYGGLSQSCSFSNPACGVVYRITP